MKSHSPREGEEKEDHHGEGREVGDEETSQQSWHSSHTQHHCKYLLYTIGENAHINEVIEQSKSMHTNNHPRVPPITLPNIYTCMAQFTFQPDETQCLVHVAGVAWGQ